VKNNSKKKKIDLYITNDNKDKEKSMKLKNIFTTNIELKNKVYVFILYSIQFKIVLI